MFSSTNVGSNFNRAMGGLKGGMGEESQMGEREGIG